MWEKKYAAQGKCKGEKCEKEKMQHKIAGVENAGMKNVVQDHRVENAVKVTCMFYMHVHVSIPKMTIKSRGTHQIFFSTNCYKTLLFSTKKQHRLHNMTTNNKKLSTCCDSATCEPFAATLCISPSIIGLPQ